MGKYEENKGISIVVGRKKEFPKGLGSRHIAAAGITGATNAIAMVISESTGAVRVFKKGKVFVSIEKPLE